MICKNCGKSLGPTEVICKNCGHPISKKYSKNKIDYAFLVSSFAYFLVAGFLLKFALIPLYEFKDTNAILYTALLIVNIFIIIQGIVEIFKFYSSIKLENDDINTQNRRMKVKNIVLKIDFIEEYILQFAHFFVWFFVSLGMLYFGIKDSNIFVLIYSCIFFIVGLITLLKVIKENKKK